MFRDELTHFYAKKAASCQIGERLKPFYVTKSKCSRLYTGLLNNYIA
jgi:hypothetical protein